MRIRDFPGIRNAYLIYNRVFCVLFSLITLSGVNNAQIPEMKASAGKEGDSLCYSVINSIIRNEYSDFKNRNCEYVLDHHPFPTLSPKDSLKITELDTIFTKSDCSFIFSQQPYARSFRINKQLLTIPIKILPVDSIMDMQADTSRISKQKFWETFRLHYGKSCFFYISKPLFSCNCTLAIIKYSISCDLDDVKL